MATDESDPAGDPRADYDYTGESVARPAVVADLDPRIDGDVRFDEFTRQQYATDASAYEVTPVGVVFPRNRGDVETAVAYCAARELPVLPRGGGTSLAGQAVNEAVVLDFSRHMDGLVSVDPEAGEAVAQPGVRLGDLNAALADHGLKFAPDPAWGDKSVLGGAIGNNSTGSHSLVYGKTDAYIEELECVLADGSVARFGEVTVDQLRERGDRDGLEGDIYAFLARVVDEETDTIRDAYPHLKRNVSGYNLDRFVEEAREALGDSEPASDGIGSDPGTVNVARLLAGSEGTLAVVTEARVSLEPVPETKSVALLGYSDLVTAMRDVEPILDHDPCAVEVMDEVLLDLAADTQEFGPLVESMVPDGASAMLLVEFYAEDDADGRRQVAAMLADRYPDADTAADAGADAVTTGAPVHALSADEAHDDAERERFWKLRKAGLPILLSRTSDAKHISFIEDTAVPPENLPEYVADFQDVLEANDTFASFYAHAGPGCLHIRPLVDTKTADGVEQMEAIAEAATDLVVEYGGSVSGEHGDGRARTQWNRKLYGDEVFELFRELKTAFDPDWILNPGQVCGDVDMTENLRFDPDYEFDLGLDPELEWDNENGMQGMVELCHGCGGCRGPQETTGGVMCPTYRAAEEESLSTRGRANMLRQAMSGDLGAEVTDEEFRHEVMDLCIGCKGCANDCPSEVDMAKLKAEVEHAHIREHGASARDHLFGNIDAVSRLGSRLAPVSNWLARLPGADWLAERTLGIAREAELPTFAGKPFAAWYDERGPAVDHDEAERTVLLFPDTYSNYVDPSVAKAAVRVLEAADVRVEVPAAGPSGRAAHSKGFLGAARERARENVEALGPRIEEGWDLVTVEPSDAVMFQRDYRDLLGGEAEPLASNAYGLCEYLDRFRLDDRIEWAAPPTSLTYHGHCHQKATKKDHHAVGVLRRAGYGVDPLDSSCCGMAGSFGYEAEHRSMSAAIAGRLLDQIRGSDGEQVVAPGASCRTQIADHGDADGVPHPVEALAAALA
ncbi:FAD-binding and (Fe-S)-binding domain-containing protein [Halorarius halobius]|uniref:FAD-binding and (Fe-S)-binding domain-containing protein n=1 Tax=Halorarius halobius TaxID=2962671 RepID=UPI0020CC335E|nr:FAD-binding and (Fe-S)-binding domain-containing protein [Halorarius halobius]